MTGRPVRVALAFSLVFSASAAVAAVDPARLDGLKARSIGPAGMSGRITDIDAFAVDPRTPDVVWVGTGEGNLRNSISHGDGVYLTRDGGKTWTNVGLAKTERIHRILVHPRDSQTVWACAVGPAWTDGPRVLRGASGGRLRRRRG